MHGGGGRRRFLAAALLGVALAAGLGRADTCMLDLWDDGQVSPGFVFPNWTKVQVGSFDVLLCQAADCPTPATEVIQGLTLVNFGSAVATDFKNVFVEMHCGATDTGLLPLTFVGNWVSDSGSHPAWTWTGASPNFAGCADLCGKNPCGAYFVMDVYADIAACPQDGATVDLGFPTTGNLYSWASWGSIVDNAGCQLPQGDSVGPEQTIVYAFKDGPDLAAPGDTLNYTIYYGRPGNTTLAQIQIFDTQPQYTHYVQNSASPPPDLGWDPNIGPPATLQWTIPGPLPVTGGPTGMLTFSLSVDWGNKESFEPGSGDVAAPEGARLLNQAQVFDQGSSCASNSTVTSPTNTAVRRFLMWMVGDNDVLFSPTLGQPPDEVIYSIFIKNVSTTKTWWAVTLWDTVPQNLDVWGVGNGLEDPCVGWTMTPTGCAAASPGVVVSAGKTILTWKLDMPPQMTLGMRWKASVRPTTLTGDTAVNILAMLENGAAGIVNGTGGSTTPKNFAHIAPIILATTYVSYCGYACSQGSSNCADMGYFIPFFPLNKKAEFELRGIYYAGNPWATVGGVSDPLGCLLGDCLGGFSGGPCPFGAGAIPGGGQAGCKAERIPAYFTAVGYSTGQPLHHIYKITSNSPVCWEVLEGDPITGVLNCADARTYAPSTTMSYVGLMHYFYRRRSAQNDTMGEALVMINTNKDPYGGVSANQPTTVHLFKFDYGTNLWTYMKTFELDNESVAVDPTTITGDQGPWRTLSSASQLIIDQSISSAYCNADGGCNCHNTVAFMPTRDTGNLVSLPGTSTFYGMVMSWQNGSKVFLGSTSAASATYDIYRYVATGSPALPSPFGSALLRGTSGVWKPMAVNLSVAGGLGAAGNPDIYDTQGPYFNSASTTAYKIVLKSGGPIQVLAGTRVWNVWGSGGSIHASNGNKVGTDFWLHHGFSDNGVGGSCGTTPTQTVDLFCPKAGMAIRAISEDGYSAQYTTGAADEVVSFMSLTPPALKRNYEFTVMPGPSFGNITAEYFQCGWERSYSAPFLVMGTHYTIVAPPTVFAGQSFWITLVVMDATGITKGDYCGTTSFTSTDSAAKMGAGGMDAYNYTWSNNISPCNAGTDNGVKVFVNVTLFRLGLQTIVATDTTDGSIAGLTAIMVVGADVKFTKMPPLSIAASGDTVQFKLCWSNYSSASAFSFSVTDAVPQGLSYVPEVASAMWCGDTDGVGAGVAVAYSTAAQATPPTTWSALGAGSPPANTQWLRWSIPTTGVGTTGCACFRVSVN